MNTTRSPTTSIFCACATTTLYSTFLESRIRARKASFGPDSLRAAVVSARGGSEVRPGFTKEEILRKPEADPRGAGGMFERLEGLLRALG